MYIPYVGRYGTDDDDVMDRQTNNDKMGRARRGRGASKLVQVQYCMKNLLARRS
jgi:hypothetical protein